MGQETVSVIIPAYKAGRTIGRAVESILAQTQPPHEILIVDDGSPEDLSAVLSRYGEQVTLVRKANEGAAAARNLGIDRCQGELVAFLDADDYWEPTKLERQREVLRKYPEVGMVTCRCYLEPVGQPRYDAPESICAPLDRVLKASGPEVFDIATKTVTPTVVLRRRVLGSHRFDRMLRTAEDRDMWVRMVASCPVYVMSEPLVTVVMEPASLSRSDIDVDCQNMLCVVHRYRKLLGRFGVRRWEATVFRRWASGCLSQGRPEAALSYACRRIWRQPVSAEGWWIVLKSMTMAWRAVGPRLFTGMSVEAGGAQTVSNGKLMAGAKVEVRS